MQKINEMADDQLDNLVAWLVGRSHVSVSDRGIKSAVGRKLNKDVQGEDRKRVLDAAVRVHHSNQKFFRDMRF